MPDLPDWWPHLMAEPLLTIDPRREEGQPCIAGTRITAETVAWCVWGDGFEDTMRGYDITLEQALTACWWLVDQILAVAPSRRNKQEQAMVEAWGEWWATAGIRLRSSQSCPEPPETPEEP